MSSTIEVFENEEAAKLLDYFVAYKKLMSAIEQIKCRGVIHSDIHFSEKQPTEKNELNQINESSLAPAMAMTLDK